MISNVCRLNLWIILTIKVGEKYKRQTNTAWGMSVQLQHTTHCLTRLTKHNNQLECDAVTSRRGDADFDGRVAVMTALVQTHESKEKRARMRSEKRRLTAASLSTDRK